MKTSDKDFAAELTFKTSRSSGKGGQHVNKTESRVSLFFNIEQSQLLNEEEKRQLIKYNKLSISSTKEWQIDVEETRSQLKNKNIAIERFYEHLKQALKKAKVRKATKPSKAAIRKRLKAKKAHSEKKQNRKKNF